MIYFSELWLCVGSAEQAAGESEKDGRTGGGASEGQQQSLPHWSPPQPDDYQGKEIPEPSWGVTHYLLSFRQLTKYNEKTLSNIKYFTSLASSV